MFALDAVGTVVVALCSLLCSVVGAEGGGVHLLGATVFVGGVTWLALFVVNGVVVGLTKPLRVATPNVTLVQLPKFAQCCC